jgi:hypothetical protein
MGAPEKDHEHQILDADGEPVRDPNVPVVEDEEIVFMRGLSGVIWAMSLPLPEAIADQAAKGELVQVNEDGTPWEPSDDDPELSPENSLDRLSREHAAAVEYARLKHARPDEDPIVLRDEAAELAGDRIPEAAVQGSHDVPGRRGGVVHGDFRDDNLELLDADEVHADSDGPVEHVEKPKPSDTKADWVAYAETQGLSHAEADGHTKAELVEKFS